MDKEITDVTLYSVHEKQDDSGDLYYIPVLHFDTAKISTIEKERYYHIPTNDDEFAPSQDSEL